MAKTIEARVRQKAATIADWNTSTLTSLDGEQLFVRSNVDDKVIAFKLGTDNKLFTELEYPDFSVRGKVNTSSSWVGAPSGVYIPVENGVYNGITVDLTDGYQVLYWDGTTLDKVIYDRIIDVIDNLTTDTSYQALSAKQGKVLEDTKEDKSNKSQSLDSSTTKYPSNKATTDGINNAVSTRELSSNKSQEVDESTVKYPSNYAVTQYVDKWADTFGSTVFGGSIDENYNLYNVKNPSWFFASPGTYDIPTIGSVTLTDPLTVISKPYKGDWGYTPIQVPDQRQMLVYKTMQDMRDMSEYDKQMLQDGIAKGATLLGYYTEGDTPSSIDYYYTSNTGIDDGGSFISVDDINLEHFFSSSFDSVYFGHNYGNIPDCRNFLKKAFDYAVINSKQALVYNKGYKYITSDIIRLEEGSNYGLIGVGLPTIECTKEDELVLSTPSSSQISLGFIVNSGSVIQEGDFNLTLDDVSDIVVGDIIFLKTTEELGTIVTRYLKGDYFRVNSIEGNVLTFDHSFGVGMSNISAIEVIKIRARRNIVIDNIKFISKGLDAVTVKFDNYVDSFIKRCEFSTSSERCLVGLQVLGYNLEISNCYSEKAFDPTLATGYGFNIAGTRVLVVDSTAKDCKHGITVATSEHLNSQIKFLRCNVYNSKGQKAIDIHGGAYDCDIEECEVYNSDGFINLRGFKGMRARYNKFFGDPNYTYTQQCVDVRSEATGILKDFQFIGNTIENFNYYVIATTTENAIYDSIIQGNIINSCGRFISIWSSGARKTTINKSLISSNIISNNLSTDILVRISGNETNIVNNTFEVNAGTGVEIQGLSTDISLNNVVESNIISKKGISTIPMTFSNTTNTIVRFNRVIGGYASPVVGGSGNTNLVVYSNPIDGSDGNATDAIINTFTAPTGFNTNITVDARGLVANNVWLRDVQKMFIQRGSLTITTDFNTLVNQGNHILGSMPDASFATYNIPVRERGHLIVFTSSATNFVNQVYVTTEGKAYSRGLFNTTWSIWRRLDSLDEITSITRPVLPAGERRILLETDTGKIIHGFGTSGSTTWKDALGTTL